MSAAATAQSTNDKMIKGLEHSQTMTQIVFEQFKTHRLAVVGSIIIIFFLAIALLAPVIEWGLGINPDEQNVFNRYAPPFTHTIDGQDVKESAVEKFMLQNPAQAPALQAELIEKSLVISAKPEDVMYDLVAKDVPEALKITKQLKSPGADQLTKLIKNFDTFHIFGTDELGRDVFIRIVYGTRVSIGVGLLVAVASALIGLLVGALAGFYGGWIDNALMRLVDSLLSLPLMPVLVVMAAIDLHKLPVFSAAINAQSESVVKLVFILCIFSWMTVARLVRGDILSLRERDFILASRTLGATDFTIIMRHILPNVLAPILVSITLGVGESILFEAALSFLGLGIQPPTPSWGNMLFNAQELIYEAPFLAVLPGVLILLTVISFNFVGDGLQSAVDPKSIRR